MKKNQNFSLKEEEDSKMAYITGSNGYEVIYGTSENDTIDGRGGSDLIYNRGNSNDTYIFNVDTVNQLLQTRAELTQSVLEQAFQPAI
ncbi:MAG: hypothetical protein MZV64_64965 [Ignavibacteriales bacterium]|nr:hypothetical protein [Ignavibacteriales bacterium]